MNNNILNGFFVSLLVLTFFGCSGSDSNASSNKDPNIEETTQYIMEKFSSIRKLKVRYKASSPENCVFEWKPRSCEMYSPSFWNVEIGGAVNLREVEISSRANSSEKLIDFTCLDDQRCNNTYYGTWSSSSGCEDKVEKNAKSITLGGLDSHQAEKLLKAFRHLRSLCTGQEELF